MDDPKELEEGIEKAVGRQLKQKSNDHQALNHLPGSL
jgi:hypothetical protein